MQSTTQFRSEWDPFLFAPPLTGRIASSVSTDRDRLDMLRSTPIEAGADLISWAQSLRLAALNRELVAKDDHVKLLEQKLAIAKYCNHEESRFASNLVEVIGRIVGMSERLFPGPVAIEYSFDPENPADEYLVFGVVAQGEYKDYRDREFEWHDEVRKIVPGSLGEFRLSVTPQR